MEPELGDVDRHQTGRRQAKPARPLRDESRREWAFSFRPYEIPSTNR